jgi:arylsulfate sulfotransferase
MKMHSQLKRIIVGVSFLMLTSFSIATVQRPAPTPRPRPQNLQVDVFDGPTPFIRFLHVRHTDFSRLKFAEFRIQPKAGSATRPINVRYTSQYLQARGYVDPNSTMLPSPYSASTPVGQIV